MSCLNPFVRRFVTIVLGVKTIADTVIVYGAAGGRIDFIGTIALCGSGKRH